MNRKTIYNIFSRWVSLQPDATAVVEDGRSVTYRQLDVMANAIMTKFYTADYPTVGIVMSHGIEPYRLHDAHSRNGFYNHR